MKSLVKLSKTALFLAVSAITLMSTLFMLIVIQFVVDMITGAMFVDAAGVLYGFVYYILAITLGSVLLLPYFLTAHFLVEIAEDLYGNR